jgi:hypothetical protein
VNSPTAESRDFTLLRMRKALRHADLSPQAVLDLTDAIVALQEQPPTLSPAALTPSAAH